VRGEQLLPRSDDAFFGRADELAQLERWLEGPGSRVLAIWGPGGIGKTRLAIEALHRAIDRGVIHDVLFCPLEKVRAPSDVYLAVLQAADLHLPPGSFDTAGSVTRHLQGGPRRLIVLDSAEGQAAAVDELIAAMAAIDDVRFIVTSQVVPSLKAAELLPVGPLGEAGALFADRAGRVRAGYRVAADDAPLLARLLERLQGHPLAIELAAMRMASLDLAGILERVESSLESLSTAAADVPERHRSIRAMLTSTWSLLPANVQQLLARISVHGGSFDLAAACAVGDAGLEEMTDALAALRSIALIVAFEVDGLGMRYELRELVREFARARLAPEEEDRAWRRCGRFYRTRFMELFLGFNASGDPRLRQRISIEHGNASAVLAWATRVGDDQLVAEYAFVVCGELYNRGMLAEVVALSEHVLTSYPAIDPLIRISLEVRHWNVRLALDPVSVDPDALEDVVLRADRIGHPSVRAYARRYLAIAARHRGQIERALQADRKGLEVAASCGERMRLKALHGLGSSLLAAGDLDAASEIVDETAFLAREIGDTDEIAGAVLLMAELAVATGDLAHAEKLLGRVLELCTREGPWQHPREHETRILLGRVLHATGSLDQAHAHLARTLERTRLEQRVWLRARCAAALAVLEHERGDLEAASAACEEARARLAAPAPATDHAALAASRAAVLADQGRRDRALAVIARAEELLAGTEDPARLLIELARGHVALADGDLEQARALAEAHRTARDLRVATAARVLAARCGRGDPITFECDLQRRVLYLPGGDVVDLSRRGAMRRILEELIARRTSTTFLTVEEAFAVGWPDQRASPDAAANRVYNAISVLRSCGLGDALEGGSDGYRLRPTDRWVITG
jgi:predicted ATPase